MENTINKRKILILNDLITKAEHYLEYKNSSVFEDFEDKLGFFPSKQLIKKLADFDKFNLDELNKLSEVGQEHIEIYFNKDRGIIELKNRG